MEKLAGAVASAQVDLNPHQVDAALFAFNSPLSKGALLADEVGLGKTIEAGLVLSQRWAERNAQYFEAETEKLDGWAGDLKLGLEREIKEMDRQIKEARRAAMAALTLEEKLAGQKQIKALEAQRNAKRRTLFDAQDEIDRRREEIIADIEGKLQQRVAETRLFSIRWTLA
jgi:adenine-specific DNA-methyltransferase